MDCVYWFPFSIFLRAPLQGLFQMQASPPPPPIHCNPFYSTRSRLTHHVIKIICVIERACYGQPCATINIAPRARAAIASCCPARLSSSSAVRPAGPPSCEHVYKGFGDLIRSNRHAPVAPFYEPIAEALHRNQRVTRRLRAEQRVARFGRRNREPRSGWSLGGRRLPAIEGKRRQAASRRGATSVTERVVLLHNSDSVLECFVFRNSISYIWSAHVT
jgi:hypothetical protein